MFTYVGVFSTYVCDTYDKCVYQCRMTADDQFASAIPECPMDGVGSLTCNNEDVPPSPDCSRSPSPGDTHCLEGKDKTCVSQPVFRREGGKG